MSGGIPFGKYRLTRRLARGGMAEVFLATQQGPGGFERTVAVKRILPHLADIPQFLNMFMDEARLAAQLSHPNIAHIYEFGNVDDSYFIAMEYIDGVDLGAVVVEGKKKPLPVEHAARIIADVCAALHYAHQQKGKDGASLGIVHRDISPQNILVSFDGAVKMVDFGIAKAAFHIERTRPGVVRGKFTYMSPEQVLGKNLDGRSDIFSAGIVLYELATTEALFPRTDAVQAMQLIRKAEIPDPLRGGKPLPPLLSRIIRRALAREREERYQTAAEMQMDLEEYLRSSSEMSNSIILGEYFREHYRRLRPEPGASASGTQAAVVGTRPAGQGGTIQLAAGHPEAETVPPGFPAQPMPVVSGTIHSANTALAEVADPESLLETTLLSPDRPSTAPRSAVRTGGEVEIEGLEGPTLVDLHSQPTALQPPVEDEIPSHAATRSRPRRQLASTTVSVRSFRRRLVVVSMITAIAVAGVIVGYVISSPPEPAAQVGLGLWDAAVAVPAVEPDLSRPAAPPTEGTLVVLSDPEGASVKVDDTPIVGTTPVQRILPAGPHTVVVSAQGHVDQQQEINVQAGEVLKANFVLKRLPERIARPKRRPKVSVRKAANHKRKRPGRRRGKRPSRPQPSVVVRDPGPPPDTPAFGYVSVTTIPWSRVYLDGKKIGITPLAKVKVGAGTHWLRFTNPEHPDTHRTVRVKGGQVTKLRFNLDGK